MNDSSSDSESRSGDEPLPVAASSAEDVATGFQSSGDGAELPPISQLPHPKSGQRPISYRLEARDPHSQARAGVLSTLRGPVEMPAFMPVGTAATVKGLTPDALESTGSRIVLGNTYHLALRPGEDVVRELGGLHRFMGWNGPMLTDSGGFQMFSLARLVKVNERGAKFRSHIDGRLLELSPERAVEIQEALGADIAMVFDHVIGLPAPRADVEEACWRSVRWAERCQHAAKRSDQTLFAIVQGGLEPELRVECAKALASLDFAGYAVGGLSVGETADEMHRILECTTPHLPEESPRYLMGVGRPEDLLNGIARGIDMFDCVMPTRNGRNAMAFTDQGPVKLRNAKFQRDPSPLQAGMPWPSGSVSRAYLRHLFASGEMLGPILVSWHNIAYYHRLMREARTAILAGAFREFYEDRMRGWGVPSAWPPAA
ncbi:MAG: tRNA guanosine(34) transglycosylase Tgt [Planctomycetales bacterium]|nr:tRNA guanosine(34) transglycosylase Tgt [Planctomycetales bacterium]